MKKTAMASPKKTLLSKVGIYHFYPRVNNEKKKILSWTFQINTSCNKNNFPIQLNTFLLTTYLKYLFIDL